MLWATFLEQTPPGTTGDIDDLFQDDNRRVTSSNIQLHWDSEKCKRYRIFSSDFHTHNYENLWWRKYSLPIGVGTAK